MNRQRWYLVPFLLVGLIGCAPGPLDPTFGLGPGLDQLVFWGILLILGLVLRPRAQRFLMRKSAGSNGGSLNASTQIAAERYAKGELDREGYLKILDDLRRANAQE